MGGEGVLPSFLLVRLTHSHTCTHARRHVCTCMHTQALNPSTQSRLSVYLKRNPQRNRSLASTALSPNLVSAPSLHYACLYTGSKVSGFWMCVQPDFPLSFSARARHPTGASRSWLNERESSKTALCSSGDEKLLGNYDFQTLS